MGRVVVFGSINRDLVVRVSRFPLPGETLSGDDFAEFPGGKGANQAVAACRLGADTILIGMTGSDGFGQSMRAFLGAEGLDTAHIGTAGDIATGIALITVEATGENTVIVVPGANHHVRSAQLDDIRLTPDDLLVTQFEIPLGETKAALRSARAAGARTLLNPAPMQDIPADMLELCDFLVLNETELATVSGVERISTPVDAEAAMQHLRARPDCSALTLIVTLGADGCLAQGPQGRMRISGQAVDVVDTTGAGDCFVGALAAGLSMNMPLEHALHQANRAAARSVTRLGAASSMPYARDLQEIEYKPAL